MAKFKVIRVAKPVFGQVASKRVHADISKRPVRKLAVIGWVHEPVRKKG